MRFFRSVSIPCPFHGPDITLGSHLVPTIQCGNYFFGRRFFVVQFFGRRHAATSASDRSRMREQHGCALPKSRKLPKRLMVFEHALNWLAFLGQVGGGGGRGRGLGLGLGLGSWVLGLGGGPLAR
ncbi:hypothetical protein F2Q68_00006346 [Brassica cretica]|nr:hypothetical protein F2Q68_00006346 [Brassica cretica]